MAKKTITFDPSAIVGNRAVRVAALVAVLIALTLGVHTIGYNSGHKEGYAAGNEAGWHDGSKAGVAVGYWEGRLDGCNFVFDQVRKPYVVGEGNPFTTWYYLMDLGNIYLSRDNCDTTGHGAAPDLNVPFIPADATVN